MPREFQRRAKRNRSGISKATDDEPRPVKKAKPTLPEPITVTVAEATSVNNTEELQRSAENESEWPVLDPDTKAYWVEINNKIIELAQLGIQDENEDLDDRRLLLRSALLNLNGKEVALATDPEASVILERLLHTMDDFSKRVLADKLSGLYIKLSQNQFASHVLQTLFSVSVPTVLREQQGQVASASAFKTAKKANAPEPQADAAALPPMTDLLVNAVQELLPDLPNLICHTYASHIVRAAIALVSGKPVEATQAQGGKKDLTSTRSKKSKKFKSAQAPMTNLMQQEPTDGPEAVVAVPESFVTLEKELYQGLSDAMSTVDAAKQIVSDPIGTLVVQVALRMEADMGLSSNPKSLLDQVLQGLVSEVLNDSQPTEQERNDFLEALLRETNTSHTFEVILHVAPKPVFDALWNIYFVGRCAKMAQHPVMSFVFGQAALRLDAEQLAQAIDELAAEDGVKTLIQSARTVSLQSFMGRSSAHDCCGEKLANVLQAAFEIDESTMSFLIPCVFELSPLAAYKSRIQKGHAPLYTMQGSLLLQSWLRLPAPHNQAPVQSLLSSSVDDMIALSRSPVSSRVLDEMLTSSTVSVKDRRKLLLKLIGHYHRLADDRIGSRVADTCWLVADVYLKDKIATSLADHQNFLLASQFGHFFLRKLNLPLHQRNNDEWKFRMAQQSTSQAPKPSKPANSNNVIDSIFASA